MMIEIVVFAKRTARLFFRRRPPTDLYPEPACANQFQPVELKGGNGGATTRRQTFDFSSVVTPAKMLAPLLAAWIPQTAALSRRGINPLDARPLEFVTRVTRQPEVLFNSLAPAGFRNDMFDA